MIKFSIGVSLLILSGFMGLNQYFDNVSKLAGAESRYTQSRQKVQEMEQFSTRMENVKRFVMPKGQDQRARIEKTLGLVESGLTFQFTSSPRPDDMENQAFYRYEFQITGPASFFELFSLLNVLESTPGFVVNQVCLKCANLNIEAPKANQKSAQIRGYLNVYNPEQV